MRLKKFYFKKINSTNNKAHIQIRKGAKNGIILAEFQTKGKGQRGNKWISFDGNLFMSIFFMIGNKISLNKITKINCLIVQKCIQKFTDIVPRYTPMGSINCYKIIFSFYEFENGSLVGGLSVSQEYPGFKGSGYVEFPETTGNGIFIGLRIYIFQLAELTLLEYTILVT